MQNQPTRKLTAEQKIAAARRAYQTPQPITPPKPTRETRGGQHSNLIPTERRNYRGLWDHLL